ncbi:Sec-independent protein translocase subunit TatA/TatB [Candidatus Poriferisodalis sp.]|uniref:Sec-independent protein translocase subunit TatA/TatB n=1 Tax=Candidatus Poriferisodalis sp. TaxID=3101277 RepID=UPI003B0268BD
MSLQPNEVLIIVLVALIVLGPKRLPGAIRGIGRAFRQVRDFSTSVRQEMDATLATPIIEPADPPKNPPSETATPGEAEPAAAGSSEEPAADTGADRPTSDGPA